MVNKKLQQSEVEPDPERLQKRKASSEKYSEQHTLSGSSILDTLATTLWSMHSNGMRLGK